MFNIKGVVLSLLLLISLGSCKNYEYHVSEEIQPYVDEYFDILDDNDIDYKDQDFYVLFDGIIDLTKFAGLLMVCLTVHTFTYLYINLIGLH